MDDYETRNFNIKLSSSCGLQLDASAKQDIAVNPQTEAPIEVKTMPENAIRVGGDRDAHNCIPSAGYTWSQTLNRCVRIWEVGTRLYSLENPNAPSTDIVIMNEEKDPIELYLATSSSGKPLLMHKAGAVWRDSGSLFSLTKAADGTISLADKMGKIISQSRPKN